MGAHGPVPKRSTERRRRNKESEPERVAARGAVPVPKPRSGWHPIAKAWFVALAESGQAQFYEPSDWAQATVWAHLLSIELRRERPSAAMIEAWASGAAELLTTEGERRRVRLEIDRTPEPQLAPVMSIADVRARAGA